MHTFRAMKINNLRTGKKANKLFNVIVLQLYFYIEKL